MGVPVTVGIATVGICDGLSALEYDQKIDNTDKAMKKLKMVLAKDMKPPQKG